MEMDLPENPPAPAALAKVIDLRRRREGRREVRQGDYQWRFVPETLAVRLETPAGTLTWGTGSAEELGRWLLAAAGQERNRVYRIELEEKHIPALRAAMNDAIVAYRSGGRDLEAERRAESIRGAHSWGWNRLEARERGRWLRLMAKRREQDGRMRPRRA